MSAHAGDLAPALDAVRAAMRAVAAVGDPATFGPGGQVEKGGAGPLTIADLASQVAAVLSLQRDLGAEIRILAEESASELEAHAGDDLLPPVCAAVCAAGFACDPATVRRCLRSEHDHGGAGCFWAIDPLDGTKGFLRGGQFAIAIALVSGARPVLAALGMPRLGERGHGLGAGVIAAAAHGQGAWQSPAHAWEPRAIRAHAWRPGAPIRLAGSVETRHSAGDALESAASAVSTVEPVRVDSQVKYGLVARGDADAYLRHSPTAGYAECVWDHAAGALVATEAGCTVTDIHGRPLDFATGHRLTANAGVLCAAPGLHAPLLSALAASMR
ncbi:MAG: inositol monophosphatase family protein [Phycisphaerales bacterium]